MTINGHPNLKMVLDTGAQIPYLVDNKITEGLTHIETLTDFSPLTGSTFETPVYELDAEIAGTCGNNISIRCNFGTGLPYMLKASLKLIGIDGIIG